MTLRIAGSVFLLLIGLVNLACASEPVHPNIIFIMADDLGSGDLGCYNPKSKIPTPNMDRLAREGMRFTDAHTPSSVCTPTRYGVLTGRYAWRTKLKSGVLWGYSPLLIEDGRATVASMLKKHGYTTGCFGKWHLGFGQSEKVDYSKPLSSGPMTVGFDTFWGIPASLDMDPYVYVRDNNVEALPTEKVAKSGHRRSGGGGMWRGGGIAPGFKHVDVLPRTTQEAVKWINKQKKDKPFFMYLPFSAPHTPWVPTDEFRGKSKAGYYGDFTVQVDACVGQVMEALDKMGLSENTLLIVTSDNGSHWPVGDIKKYDHAANMHYRGQKADIWEGGHRVPFIVRWPGNVKPGSVSHETICLTDLYATAAGIVGEKLNDNQAEDSYNVLPALLGKSTQGSIREATVHHSLHGMFAIRQGHWKLIQGHGSGGFTRPNRINKADQAPGVLYNLKEDPSETNDVYAENPEVVKRLSQLLTQYKTNGRSR